MYKEDWPDATRHKCPGCGRVVLLDEKQKRSAHAVPLCDWWTRAMKETKGEMRGEHAIEYPGRKGGPSA